MLLKNFLFFCCIFFVCVFYAQDSTYTEKWNNGERKIEGSLSGGLRNGDWIKWNEKGELIEKSIYENGNLISLTKNEYYSHTKNLIFEVKKYNSNKTLIEHKTYQSNDSKTFNSSFYYDNGKIKSKGKTVLGNKEGKWLYYNREGELIETIKYKSGVDTTNKKEQKQKSKQISKTKNNYKKGHYIDRNDEKYFGYFDIGKYNIKYKKDPNKKGHKLNLANIKSYEIGTKRYIIIKSVKIKMCSPIGFPTYKNVVAKIAIQGQINLFTTYITCSATNGSLTEIIMPDSPAIYSSTKIFIVQKGNDGDFMDVNQFNTKKFRDLLKLIMSDKPEFLKNMNIEEANFDDLVPIIQKYNLRH